MRTNYYVLATLAASLFSMNVFGAENESVNSGMNSDLNLLYVLIGLAGIQLTVAYFLAKTLKSLTGNSEWLQKVIGNMSKNKSSMVIIGMLLSTGALQAADGAQTAPFIMSDSMFYALLSLNVFLFAIILFLFTIIKNAVNILTGKSETEEAVASVFDKAIIALTDNVPLDREHEVMTDHEYDGIRELDNNLPPWWVYGFYLTIIFAVVYIAYFHIYDGKLSAEEYKVEMAEGEAAKEAYMTKMAFSVDENSVILVSDASKLKEGQDIYKQNCAACHGPDGQGGVGPNLTDDYWLHGGSINDVFKVIKYGVPEKGMIAWQAQFSPPQMQNIASYILTLVGTNPPNQKEAQGELFTPAASPSDTELEATEDGEEIQQASL